MHAPAFSAQRRIDARILFEAIDTDGDGTIDHDELLSYMLATGVDADEISRFNLEDLNAVLES